MRLWLLQRIPPGGDYDEAHGFVVRAEVEVDAREMAAEKAWDEGRDTWLDHRKSTCEDLVVDGEAGVVLSDFNPG